jgi:carboxypeptidase PM20D1
MEYIIGIVSILIIIIIIMVIRTIHFKPVAIDASQSDPIELDEERIVHSLKQMIKFRTISHIDRTKNDVKAFVGFRQFLRTNYPLINQFSKVVEIEESGILFHIKGKSNEKPVVLMAHYDVVPENGVWKYNPFLGEVVDGAIYGRGTLDTKGSLCGVMESVEYMLKHNHIFQNDLYLAFSGDEEVDSVSANNIVSYLEAQGIQPNLVLDEGGAVVSKVFPGVKKKAAVVGIAEKGYIGMELTAKSSGGHASTPPDVTPVTQLAKSITTLNEGKLFKMKLTKGVFALFDTVARHAESFAIKMIFANLWITLPLVKLIAKSSGGEMLAMFRTTQAFTMMQGSEAVNVLPTEAKVGINYRLLTGETKDQVLQKVSKKVAKYNVEAHIVYGNEASSVSEIGSEFRLIEQAIIKTWGDIATTPYLMMAATDSRFYHRISSHVYRFSPMELTKAERGMIHGVDEQIKIENLLNVVRFYIHLLRLL